MHQRQSRRDEGMQTIERKTEGRRDEENARKKMLVLTPALLLALFCLSFVFQKRKKKPTKKFSKSAAAFFIVLLLPFAFPFALTPPLTPRLFFYSFLFHNCLFLRCVCLLNVFVTQCDDVFRDKELASQLTGSLCGLGRSPKSPVTRQKGQISWSCKPPTRK